MEALKTAHRDWTARDSHRPHRACSMAADAPPSENTQLLSGCEGDQLISVAGKANTGSCIQGVPIVVAASTDTLVTGFSLYGTCEKPEKLKVYASRSGEWLQMKNHHHLGWDVCSSETQTLVFARSPLKDRVRVAVA